MASRYAPRILFLVLGVALICCNQWLNLLSVVAHQNAEPPRIDYRVSKARELTSLSVQEVARTAGDDRSYVVPASANMPMLTVPQDNFAVSTVEQTVQGQVLRWGVERDGMELRLVASGTILIRGQGAQAGATLSCVVDGNIPIPVNAASDGSWTATVSMSRPGTSRIEISRTVGVDKSVHFFNAIAPTEDDSRMLEPIITKVSNNSYKTPTNLQNEPVRVYGGYLNLSGLRVLNGTRLQFAVFDKNAKLIGIALPSSPVNPRPDASWDAELDIAFPPEMSPAPDTTGFVRAISFSAIDGLHRFSRTQVNFQVAAVGTQSTRLKIIGVPMLSDGSAELAKSDGEYLSKDKRFIVKGAVAGADANLLADSRIVVFLNNAPIENRDIAVNTADQNKWNSAVEVNADSKYTVEVATVLGRSLYGDRSLAAKLNVRSSGPRVMSVAATNAALDGIKVTFDEKIKLVDSTNTNLDLNAAFVLVGRETKNIQSVDSTGAKPSLDSDNSLILTYENVPPDVYTFTVKASLIKNLFGTPMAADYSTQLFRPLGAEEPMTSRGITGPTGPFVAYGEYTKPREFIDGFNPSDHVETRISRLYYFRDAHRVVQIINRDARSYNRSAVEMQQQLASKAHQIADQATDDRRAKERNAVQASQKTREAEQELQQAQQTAQSASNQAADAQGDLQQANTQLRTLPLDSPSRAQLEANASNLSSVVSSLERVAESARNRAQAAANKVQQLREDEARVREQWQSSIAVEDRAREEQFRREVAAAHADPDTFAPGAPGSQDPVQQVSVSVIGEGLIQLRGPIKGINIIRNMINQIDAPVGQVRVGVHTVQINGEKGDRMEIVAGKIQRFVDHSRFLTLQSAEMLRKAIVRVAAQRALECGNVPGGSQADRDRSYLFSFFGEDFVRELETMDSEFLATGNKLLSIHSMDSTSLASALFLMALAKNTTRMQIQQEFEAMMVNELPAAEQNYFEAGLTCDGKHKLFDKHCHRNEFTLLSQNARFQSIRGMFNADLAEDDTMTPIQREFIRLAQIFKSRLVVEMELKQRVMERAVIEERLGNRLKELTDARFKEEQANQLKQKSQEALKEAQKGSLVASRQLSAIVQSSQRQAELISVRARDSKVQTSTKIEAIANALADRIRVQTEAEQWIRTQKTPFEVLKSRLLMPLKDGETIASRIVDFKDNELTWHPKMGELKWPPERFAMYTDWPPAPGADPSKTTVILNFDTPGKIRFSPADEAERIELETTVATFTAFAASTKTQLDAWPSDPEVQDMFVEANNMLAKVIQDSVPGNEINNLVRIRDVLQKYSMIAAHRAEKLSSLFEALNCIVSEVGRPDADLQKVYANWLQTEHKIYSLLSENERKLSEQAFNDAKSSFQTLQERLVDFEFSTRDADASRRPLDHKKFLDMLVDEMEDKYVELLEGTRAHTANIDAYIKRLITSLDDDFNTQFYYPTFRKVRDASQMWDVTMGQVETTNVLANNRAFGKVSPEATMEFDLPKREIMITEAMNGAKAVIDDVGALAQDPTFLALAQMKGGSPTSSPMAGATGGHATVRNVLPGLSTDTAESVMGQQGPGGTTFGTAMEALIPDPAIYKFETGTGWEIRPVIQPDGQALVFHFNYMYTTNVREPVRADEKHLGRVKRHFVDTDVQLSNFELREISRYTVALKASRTSRGVPLFEDVPVVGALFRPLPSDESSLQQNVILGQATIFPTVFDLMGLRWAPVVADLDPLRLSNDEFIVRNRRRAISNRVFDESSSAVDRYLRTPEAERRMDLYRSQETIPTMHPNGYDGPGANIRESQLQEGYSPTQRQESQFIPGDSIEGSLEMRGRRRQNDLQNEMPLLQPKTPGPNTQPKAGEPSTWDNSSSRNYSSTPVANASYQTKPESTPSRTNAVTPALGKSATSTRVTNPPNAQAAPSRLPQLRNPFSRGQPKK